MIYVDLNDVRLLTAPSFNCVLSVLRYTVITSVLIILVRVSSADCNFFFFKMIYFVLEFVLAEQSYTFFLLIYEELMACNFCLLEDFTFIIYLFMHPVASLCCGCFRS